MARAGPIPAIAMSGTFLAVLLLPVAEAVGVGVLASLLMQLNQESLDLRLVRLRLDAEDRLVEDVEYRPSSSRTTSSSSTSTGRSARRDPHPPAPSASRPWSSSARPTPSVDRS